MVFLFGSKMYFYGYFWFWQHWICCYLLLHCVLHICIQSQTVSYDIWHVICDTWRVVNVLSKFHVPSSYGGSEGVLKIWRKRMNKWINHKGVCKTTPATLALINMLQLLKLKNSRKNWANVQIKQAVFRIKTMSLQIL